MNKQQRWRKKNMLHVRAYAQVYAHKRRQIMSKLKAHPCVDCHVQYAPWQMQFGMRQLSR